MHGSTALPMKALLVLSAVAALALPAAALAWSAHASNTPRIFHVDILADQPHHYHCGAEWHAPSGTCTGSSPDGYNAFGFNRTTLTVSWCAAAPSCALGQGHRVPAGYGYDRWVKLCRPSGQDTCSDWLLAAVLTRGGMFSVVAGKVFGHQVVPDSGDLYRTGLARAPMKLTVQFKGHLSNGDGASPAFAYWFQLAGWLTF